jgi:hypothetical protein
MIAITDRDILEGTFVGSRVKLLRRIWLKPLSTGDRTRINSAVIGEIEDSGKS